MHSRCSGTFPSALLVVLWLFGSTTASAAPLVTLANGFEIYNTGMLLSGSLDQRWYMTVNPYNASADVYLDAASYLSANDTSSAWVGPSGPHVHAPESVYRIATVIDLTGLDLASVVLSGFWISDNGGLDILVNGNSTGQTNTGAHTALPGASTNNAFSISLADGLVAALNILEFEWGNGPAGGAGSQVPNPIHVRVEFVSAESTVIPVPAAFVLLGSALGLLAGLRRRSGGQLAGCEGVSRGGGKRGETTMNVTRGGLTATIAAGLISVGGMAAAAPVTLDFSGNICNGGNACNNSNGIDQSYGDIVGELDVQWDRSPFLDGLNNMSWWGTSYGDLQGVAFGDPSPSASFAISFVAAPGFGVALHSFDIAAWSTSNSRVVVVDLAGGAELFDSGVIEVPNTGHMSFLDPGGPDSWMSSVGLQLLVGPDGYNVGIDNITYSTFDVTVVPLPPAGLLLLTGVAAALGVLRRRRS